MGTFLRPAVRLPLALGVTLVVLAGTAPAVARAQQDAQPLIEPLIARPESGVGGKVTIAAEGPGTRLALDVLGLTPGTAYRAVLNGGTCARPGASLSTVASFSSDATGHATAAGAVLFRGADPVPPAALLDGDHVVRIVRADQSATAEAEVACAPLPRRGGVPVRLPATGGAPTRAAATLGMGVVVPVALGVLGVLGGTVRRGIGRRPRQT